MEIIRTNKVTLMRGILRCTFAAIGMIASISLTSCDVALAVLDTALQVQNAAANQNYSAYNTGTSSFYSSGSSYSGSSSSSSSSSSYSSSSSTTKQKKRCGACGGEGYTIEYTAGYGLTKYCNTCKKEVSAAHYHKKCSQCNGTGMR